MNECRVISADYRLTETEQIREWLRIAFNPNESLFYSRYARAQWEPFWICYFSIKTDIVKVFKACRDDERNYL